MRIEYDLMFSFIKIPPDFQGPISVRCIPHRMRDSASLHLPLLSNILFQGEKRLLKRKDNSSQDSKRCLQVHTSRLPLTDHSDVEILIYFPFNTDTLLLMS